MRSPASSSCVRTLPLSYLVLLVISCLLLSSVTAAPPPPSGPPHHSHKSSSSAPLTSTAVPFTTSSARPVTSASRPTRLSSTASVIPIPLPSSTSRLPPSPVSWTSSSQLASPTVYATRMSLARMLSLVFVSLLFVVLVISFVWYFWRKQWLAQREQQTQPLSEDGWLHIDERGQVVREGASQQSVQPYQPSMLAYMAPSPTPAALTISYQAHVDINSERHFVRF